MRVGREGRVREKKRDNRVRDGASEGVIGLDRLRRARMGRRVKKTH